jgi:nucleoside-diphosphate-sugar epimerase
MRIVLFGASGFIGAHVRAVLAGDERVSYLDCPGRDRVDLLAAAPSGDGADALTGLLQHARPDAVVLCTGRLGGSGVDLVRANTLPVAAVVEAVATAAPGARVVRLGSAGEYGVVPAGRAVREDHPALPVSEYGVSHLAATRLLELASVAGRVDGVTLRVFNPIGPGLKEDTLLGRAAALLREALNEGWETITLGDLSSHRDFVDVRDVATAVTAAIFAERPAPRVVNVASGRAVPARLVVQLLADEAGFRGRIVERGAGPARSASVAWMLADIERAASALGWSPAHDLPSSVRAVWSSSARAGS